MEMIAELAQEIASPILTVVEAFLIEILASLFVVAVLSVGARRYQGTRSRETREARRQSAILQAISRDYLSEMDAMVPGVCTKEPLIRLDGIAGTPEITDELGDGVLFEGNASSQLNSTIAHGALTIVKSCVVPGVLDSLRPVARDAVAIVIAEDLINKKFPIANQTFVDEVVHPAVDLNGKLQKYLDKVRRILLCAHTIRAFLRLLREIARSISDKTHAQVTYVIACLHWLLNSPGTGVRRIHIGRIKVAFVILPFWLCTRPEALRERYRKTYSAFTDAGYQWVHFWCVGGAGSPNPDMYTFKRVLQNDTTFVGKCKSDVKSGIVRGSYASVFFASVKA